MVNLVDAMTKPYMMAGKLASKGICGVGSCVGSACCGAKDVLSNLNPFDDDRDEGEPLRPNLFGGTFQGKNTKFEDHTWNQLPGRCKDAAKTLWLDQATWDAKGWSEIEEYWWEDLSDDQKSAAATLGWDQDAWDSKYNDKYWSELPSHVQKAGEKIGFSQQRWDEGDWPEIGEKYWGEMSSDEKKALHVLGYTKYDWE